MKKAEEAKGNQTEPAKNKTIVVAPIDENVAKPENDVKTEETQPEPEPTVPENTPDTGNKESNQPSSENSNTQNTQE